MVVWTSVLKGQWHFQALSSYTMLTRLVHMGGNFCALDSYKWGGCPQVPQRGSVTHPEHRGWHPFLTSMWWSDLATSGNLLAKQPLLCTLNAAGLCVSHKFTCPWAPLWEGLSEPGLVLLFPRVGSLHSFIELVELP